MQDKIRALAQYIIDGEYSFARGFILKLYDEAENKKYAGAFITVLLSETGKYLQNTVKSFYCDKSEVQMMASEPFPENVKKTVNYLSLKIKESRKIDETTLLLKAKEYIDENIDSKQLSVEECADFTGISAVNLSRIFSKHIHLTPSEYICRKRITAALRLLKNTNIMVNEAAEKTGFFSTATFIRAFKRNLGTTPGKYRFLK